MEEFINKGASFISSLTIDDLRKFETNDLLYLAEKASHEATFAKNAFNFDYAWGAAAINIYNKISELTNSTSQKSSAMYLMITGLSKGNVPNIYKGFYNNQILLDWFLENLTLNPEEFKMKYLKITELELKEMKTINMIRAKLGVIKYFSENCPNEIPPSMVPWLEMMQSLW